MSVICEETPEFGHILDKHDKARSSLIPILQDVQGELGYIPEASITYVSRHLKVPEAEIYGVATFYSQFRLAPPGKNVFIVCDGTACHVKNGATILGALEKQLGIKAGETTDDRKFTIKTVACLGACALAPAVILNDKVYGKITVNKLKVLIKEVSASKGKGARRKKPLSRTKNKAKYQLTRKNR